MKINKIKELVGILEESHLDDLEIEVFNFFGGSIRVRKSGGSIALDTSASRKIKKETITDKKLVPDAGKTALKESEPEQIEEKAQNYFEIVSPIVGILYRAPAPDAEPYVKVGDHIERGQVVCIVEAMKLMNEIQSEVNGTIKKILVENAQPVEFGQVLFLVEPD